MQKIFLVSRFEFIQTARRWQFLLITLGLPCFMGLLMVLSGYSSRYAKDSLKKSIGSGEKILVQDQGKILDGLEIKPPFILVSDLKHQALSIEKGEFLAGFLIPKDYMKSGQVNLIVSKNKAIGAFSNYKELAENLIRTALLQKVNESTKERIFSTVRFKLQIATAENTLEEFNWHQMIVPALFLIIFILSTSTASTFLLQSVSEEKENRTVEILLSTLNDTQLIAGKALGLGAAAMLQVLTWSIMGLFAVDLLAKKLNLPLSVRNIPLADALYALVVLFLGFLMFTAIMIGVGSLATNYKDAQQLSSFFIIASFLPIYVIQIVINDIQGNLARFLYYFPLTSPLVLVTRFSLGNLPLWESVSGLLVLAIFAFLFILISARLFRLGCLMFNRRPSAKEIFHKVIWR